ncbi:glycosyltransferase family 4 protein [Zobellia roscoffensis]|uniref:glycosyltransferase family 4 protein n=1 Tax=Zobellia roscoffensis TaxID=2779508 RepID=UPI00188B8A24|nr:glycosyltransferase family 4 protein [Zobellia roscoffensis]
MKIGIASPCDINAFSEFFKEQDLEVLRKNCIPNNAPAVNTLLLSFLKAGHHVSLFTLTSEDFVLQGQNINIYGIKACNKYPVKYLWGDFVDAKNVEKVIEGKVERLDVLHAHWTYSYAYAAMNFVNRLPVFCTVRDWASYIWQIESLKNKITWSFRYVMNGTVFRNSNIHFIANSPYTATRIKDKYKLQVPIIPNPIKETFLINKKNVLPENLELLCISTSNDKRKNIETLLKTFQLLLKEYPNSHLSLIGNPFIKGAPKIAEWKEKGLLNKVTLVGPVNHDSLTEYLDRSRVLVVPSLEETFGNTLLEGMARKVPVVGGKSSGAVSYVLQKGKAGYLCDVSDVGELTETIAYVYNHQSETRSRVEYAFKHLIDNYLDKNVCNKHIDYYRTKQFETN